MPDTFWDAFCFLTSFLLVFVPAFFMGGTWQILSKVQSPESIVQSLASLVLPEELTLLKSLARFPDSIVSAAESYEPHRIAGRIYRLARDFSAFYDKAPVLKAETPELRDARLFLVEMTGRVLATGLALLGIEVTDRM